MASTTLALFQFFIFPIRRMLARMADARLQPPHLIYHPERHYMRGAGPAYRAKQNSFNQNSFNLERQPRLFG